MAIDERHRQQWSEERDQRERFRAAWSMLKKFSPREGEDDETFRRRMAWENQMGMMEMDAREEVANDDDVAS